MLGFFNRHRWVVFVLVAILLYELSWAWGNDHPLSAAIVVVIVTGFVTGAAISMALIADAWHDRKR